MNRGNRKLVSLCEKKFVVDALKNGKRVDGRDVYDYRELNISLGQSPGEVEVTLGKTRPTDGLLFFDVELSPMASPAFETGKISTAAVEINRVLERCQKESRAVDVESLCIIAGEKVWEIRVELHVLDHCGNILDCASIASIVALKHFRRPDATVIGQEATIHPVTERDPVPLNVNHSPLCFSFAFFAEGGYMVVDPSLEEEQVMEGRLIVGMNAHQEVCVLQMNGGVPLLPEQVMRCTQIAATKCMELTNKIKAVLSGKKTDESSVLPDIILNTQREEKEVEVISVDEGEPEKMAVEGSSGLEDISSDSELVESIGPGTAELRIGMGGPSTWEVVDSIEISEDSIVLSEEDQAVCMEDSAPTSEVVKDMEAKEDDIIVVVSDSEEEETTVLTASELESGQKKPAQQHHARATPTNTQRNVRTISITRSKQKKKGAKSRKTKS